jgi:hypothetical protein
MTSSDRQNEVNLIAETFGIVVGAASCCERVTEERVGYIARRLREVVLSSAANQADAKAAGDRLAAALDAGRTAVETGKIDPQDAEAVLVELEHRLFAQDIIG